MLGQILDHDIIWMIFLCSGVGDIICSFLQTFTDFIFQFTKNIIILINTFQAFTNQC